MELNIKSAKAKAMRQGLGFNEEKFIKKQSQFKSNAKISRK